MRRSLLLWFFPAQLHAFFSVKTIDSLGIDLPALSPQQPSNPPVTKSQTQGGDLFHSLLERLVDGALLCLVVIARPLQQYQRTRSRLAQRKSPLKPFCQLSLTCRPQSFFAITSCRTCLSRLRSATSCASASNFLPLAAGVRAPRSHPCLHTSSSSCKTSLRSLPSCGTKPLLFLRLPPASGHR